MLRFGLLWITHLDTEEVSAPSDEQIEQARRRLKMLVTGQWRQEILIRQLDDPAPLSVRWRLTRRPVMDRANIAAHHGQRSVRAPGRTVFDGRADHIPQLARRFQKLDRRRLVILGSPGTGKTTLAILLLRQLLRDAASGDPVPVLFTMSGWDPAAETLRAWMTRRLTHAYPALRAAAFGLNAPAALIEHGKILPILDGLDESGPGWQVRRAAPTATGRTHPQPTHSPRQPILAGPRAVRRTTGVARSHRALPGTSG